MLALVTITARSQPSVDEAFSFSVIADVPYDADEILQLDQHFFDHNRYSPADFVAHLGDIKSSGGSCDESHYQIVADSLRLLAVPAFIVPGDNEWTDCSDPDQAWAFWEDHLLGIEADFCGTPPLDSQAVRPENFAFLHKGVLFVGINLPDGAPSEVVQADIDWIDAQFAEKGFQARAAVVLAHRDPSGALKAALASNGAAFAKPVLYLHGNGHSWSEDAGFFGEPNMLLVQLERGTAGEPPVRVDVSIAGEFALERDPWPVGTLPYNRPPCVDAGPDLSLAAGEAGMLVAFAVDDGIPEPATLGISWEQLAGPAPSSIVDPGAESTPVSFPEPGTYVLEVTASDGVLSASDSLQVTVGDPTSPPEVTIAFIGDQGLGADSQAVLQLIWDEGADAVVHSGDFDYENDPAAWEAQIDGILGSDFPYFASVGNHDDLQFYTPGGYQDRLEARMNRLGIPWTGDLGVQSALHFEDIFVVLTAPDIFGEGDGFHDLYIRDQLAADDSIWSISSWHKNMTAMQVGGKTDETGWGVYEESRRGGAIVATAHEHSYSRTHLLSSVQGQTVASAGEPLVLAADDPATAEDEGRNFAFVSGLGGSSVRFQMLDGPWWASIYTANQGADHGALFGVFHYQGDPRLAYFYFKDISGTIADEFFVVSAVDPTQPLLTVSDASVAEGDAGDTDLTFDVTLHAADGQDVTVDYATGDGTALSGEDYAARSGSLTLSDSVTVQTVSVPIHGDADPEPDETFVLRLSNPSHGAVVDGEAEGTVLDDDSLLGIFTLTVTATSNGSVGLSPPGGAYEAGTLVTLSALPDPGFAFDGWTGDLVGLEDPATLLMDSNHSVGARFVALPPPGSEVAFDEEQSGSSAESNLVSTAAPIGGVDGALYLAAISSKSFEDVTAVSGLGLTWSPVRAQCGGRSQTGVSVWQARGEPTGDDVVTATLASARSASVISVSRYSGAGALGNIASANSNGPSGACEGGIDGEAYAFDLATSSTDSLVYVAAALRNKDHTPGAGYTERVELYAGSGGSTAGLATADGVAGSAPIANVQGFFSSTVDYGVVALEIESLPAGPFELVLDASPGGTASADPAGGPYDPDTSVTLTATADPGFAFAGWSGDVSGTQNPMTLLMDADKSVTASFAPEHAVTLSPDPGGSIGLAPPGGLYLAGTVVVVTATADAGYLFRGWSGDLSGEENPTTLVVDADKAVGAQFARPTLVVTAGSGGNVDPAGGTYDAGSVVTLTATPEPGFAFAGWGGDLSGSQNPATLVMDDDRSVSASFAPLVTLSSSPATGGSIALDPPGGSYAQGTVVTLTATPDVGYLFAGWGGDLTGSANPTTLTLDADKSVTASFVEAQVTLSVTTSGSGSVSLSPPGGTYDAGTVVTLTATPDPGFAFSGWSGDLSGSQNPATLTLDADKSVTATFVGPQFTLTVTVEGSGKVRLQPSGGVYTAGTVVTLKATPHKKFTGWSGDLSGTSSTETLVMDSDKDVTASF
jgi:hypothetical protein